MVWIQGTECGCIAGCRRCQALLDKIRREQREARAGRQFMTASCPICLEDFTPDVPASPVTKPGAKAAAAPPSGHRPHIQ